MEAETVDQVPCVVGRNLETLFVLARRILASQPARTKYSQAQNSKAGQRTSCDDAAEHNWKPQQVLRRTLDSLGSRWIILAIGKERLQMLILIVEDEAAIARFLSAV